ncbi:N-acetyltransferase [Rhodohalobacter sp. SW132]|uniref:GNAT family N-acetyltransferase n=1 Tax=Rhodohalobacter sp. SW132 TaxID=2293433 RepID=UPI000E245D5B|nr:GNAT family N-acetyltransferase [Rhodohalobacter sp. SW132]REL38957.1 N-acetyltransferase [Rhodohalobacter sp. SW132]
MKNRISIRKATADDAESIAEFNIAMAMETEQKKLERDGIEPGVKALFDHPEYGFYLVAESGDEIIGSLMVTKEWSDWRNGLFWWIQSVYVIPEFRRRGVYRAMYEKVKQLADQAETVCGFRLYVEKENTVAQQTYLSLGMKETHYKMFEEIT